MFWGCDVCIGLLGLTYCRKRAVLAFPAVNRLRHMAARWAASGRQGISSHPIRKKATPVGVALLRIRSLAMTYSHMGKPHTTIGDASFHF